MLILGCACSYHLFPNGYRKTNFPFSH
uniref:Uncharacterized protein n=1 Tax=Arundo donax TaxID=35708 RepID=A0A0A8XY57_ARUDO